MQYYQWSGSQRGGGFNIGCLIFGILFMVGTFFIMKWMFKLLMYAAPILFVLALIINWRVVANTGKNFLKTLETNPIKGILLAVLGFFGFPLLALYLFLAALGARKIESIQQQFQQNSPFGAGPVKEDTYAEYEEIETKPKRPFGEPLSAPEMPEKEPVKPPEEKPKPKANPYDSIFEED